MQQSDQYVTALIQIVHCKYDKQTSSKQLLSINI